jgi:hypothetical protein
LIALLSHFNQFGPKRFHAKNEKIFIQLKKSRVPLCSFILTFTHSLIHTYTEYSTFFSSTSTINMRFHHPNQQFLLWNRLIYSSDAPWAKHRAAATVAANQALQTEVLRLHQAYIAYKSLPIDLIRPVNPNANANVEEDWDDDDDEISMIMGEDRERIFIRYDIISKLNSRDLDASHESFWYLYLLSSRRKQGSEEKYPQHVYWKAYMEYIKGVCSVKDLQTYFGFELENDRWWNPVKTQVDTTTYDYDSDIDEAIDLDISISLLNNSNPLIASTWSTLMAGQASTSVCSVPAEWYVYWCRVTHTKSLPWRQCPGGSVSGYGSWYYDRRVDIWPMIAAYIADQMSIESNDRVRRWLQIGSNPSISCSYTLAVLKELQDRFDEACRYTIAKDCLQDVFHKDIFHTLKHFFPPSVPEVALCVAPHLAAIHNTTSAATTTTATTTRTTITIAVATPSTASRKRKLASNDDADDDKEHLAKIAKLTIDEEHEDMQA